MAVELTAGGARVAIRPECGGTVDDLCLEPAGGGAAIAILAPERRSASVSAGGAGRREEWRRQECDPGLFRGRLLAPFSDRIPGGRYSFRGVPYELPLNDEDAGDAIHGFLYGSPMSVSLLTAAEMVLECRSLGEWPGYPFDISITARYELLPESFCLTLTAANIGSAPLPVTLGWHPYFTLPGVPSVDTLWLRMPAERYVAVDERLLPTGELPPVAGTPWDFRRSRRIGPGELDLGFLLDEGDLLLSEREPGGAVSEGSGGKSVAIRMHGAFRYCQLFVPPDRGSIAIEPLTAATNAFNEPELGLSVLGPGEELTGRCEITLL